MDGFFIAKLQKYENGPKEAPLESEDVSEEKFMQAKAAQFSLPQKKPTKTK